MSIENIVVGMVVGAVLIAYCEIREAIIARRKVRPRWNPLENEHDSNPR